MKYELVNKEILYQGVFRLVRLQLKHELFNGEWGNLFTREILERYVAAAVLPYDPVKKRVILIEQFRPGALSDPQGPWQIEIPAGVIDTQESPLAVAIREAKEEANCEVRQLELICEYFVSPGGSNEYIHIYAGLVDADGITGVYGLTEEHEDIRVLNLSIDEALQLLHEGKIKNAPAIIALQWLAIKNQL